MLDIQAYNINGPHKHRLPEFYFQYLRLNNLE